MKKLFLSIVFLSTFLRANEPSQHNSSLVPRVSSALKYPSLGFGVGLSSGALCGLVDAVTRDSLWIFTWISTISLRELMLRDYLSNNPAFKDASSDRKEIASITGHLSAWIAYCIIRSALR